ncbi:hypothetical protein GW17_00041234, partial [Ensete ventricosum]
MTLYQQTWIEGEGSWIDCTNQAIGFGGFPPRHVEGVNGVPFTRGVSSPAPPVAYADSALAVSDWLRCPPGARQLRGASLRVSATEEKKTAAPEAPEAPAGFTPPQLDPNTPSPIFGGSTGGLLRKAQVEEFYVITWDSPKEQVFEMPTGGAAIMRQGPNLLKLARKEQCLALGTRLRSKYKIKYQFYRVFPNGEVQYLH